MPDIATEAQDDPAVVALRAKLLGGGVTIQQIAAATGTCTRTVRNWIDRYNIPFRHIDGIGRVLEPAHVQRALVKESNTAPRGPGRPRKVAG